VIAGTNILRFGENGGSNFGVYDWNTGYASSSYQQNQEYAFTVASIDLFFQGTGVSQVPVYGFAVDNDGRADVQFFAVSEDTFENNVPEPSLLSLFACGTVSGLFKRKRNTKTLNKGLAFRDTSVPISNHLI